MVKESKIHTPNIQNKTRDKQIYFAFTKNKGFTRAFILGGILGIVIFLISELFLLYLILTILLFALLIYSQNTIKFKKIKKYNLFVFSVTALFGFLFGGILLYLMEKHVRLFDWIVPLAIAVFIILLLIGIHASSSTIILFNTSVSETIPSGEYYYLSFIDYQEGLLSGSYSASGPISVYLLNTSEFELLKNYEVISKQYLWCLENYSTGYFDVSIEPGNYYLVFINQEAYPVTISITRNITLST